MGTGILNIFQNSPKCPLPIEPKVFHFGFAVEEPLWLMINWILGMFFSGRNSKKQSGASRVNSDIEIYHLVLEHCSERFLLFSVHLDQLGFVRNRYSSLNIRQFTPVIRCHYPENVSRYKWHVSTRYKRSALTVPLNPKAITCFTDHVEAIEAKTTSCVSQMFYISGWYLNTVSISRLRKVVKLKTLLCHKHSVFYHSLKDWKKQVASHV